MGQAVFQLKQFLCDYCESKLTGQLGWTSASSNNKVREYGWQVICVWLGGENWEE